MQNIWKNCLEKIKDSVNEQTYNTWFTPTSLLALNDENIEIEVPNRFFKDWLFDNYLELIKSTLTSFKLGHLNIVFKVKKEKKHQKDEANHQLEQLKNIHSIKREQTNLNPAYNFDNFVIGSSNQFPHAAAMAVAAKPGKAYNPLFIYGGVGLGKTHLLNAIGNKMILENPNLKILYITADKFMNEFVAFTRKGEISSFTDKFRNLDCILIDDIQFIGGKEATQAQFFHIFNSLHEDQKQIVIASDRFPKEIPKLEERLRSRFEWGLIVDIQPPDTETKIAILKRKAEINGIAIPGDVVEFLAELKTSNIREIEGFLIKLGAFSSLSGAKITVGFAKEVLKNVIGDKEKELTFDTIIKDIAKRFNVKVSDIKSQKKLQIYAFPRQVVMYVAKLLLDIPLVDIGKEFKKNHATVIYSIKKIEEEMKKDEKVKKIVDEIVENLKN